MRLLKNKEIPLSAWENLVNKNPLASPFQTPIFYNLFNTIDGYSAEALAIANSSGLIALAVITIQKESGIKAILSARGIIYGGPIIENNNNEALSLLLDKIHETIGKHLIYIETRNFSNYDQFKTIFSEKGWSYEPRLNIQINLSKLNIDTLTSKFKYNRRREIRQSINNGAGHYLCSNEEELKKVYLILKQNYRERVKLPLPSIDFFLEFFRRGNMKVFVVNHKDNIIGGSFCLILKERALYTFYYCGLRDYHKRIFPTHLSILAAMEYCIDEKIPLFDFMGAGKPNIVYGVRNYKLEFGGELVEHGRFLHVLKPRFYRIGKLGLKMQARLS